MGDQFWWFYDVIAAAIVLVCIFLAGKKGAFKALLTMMCYLVGLVLAFSISTSVAGTIQKNAIRPSNIKNMNKALSESNFNGDIREYLNTTFNAKLEQKKTDEILASGEDIEKKLYEYLKANTNNRAGDEAEFGETLREGYAQVMSGMVSKYMSTYAAETAANSIRENKNGDFNELIELMQEPENRSKASAFIVDNYTAPAYQDIVKLSGFLILLVIVILVTLVIVRTFTRNNPDFVSLGSHIAGGFTGIIIGAVLIFAAAVIVRVNVILGSNEMLFFNHDAIDQTYVFKYAYNYVLKI